MFRFLLLYVCLLPVCAHLYGQVKEQTIEEIQVTNQKKEKESIATQVLDKKTLSESQPTDIGDALIRFTGISIKNYGGIGGLKTFSFRGIGSAHTGIISDGFLVSNVQTGQVNLGNLPIQNVTQLSLGRLVATGLYPANAYVMSSALEITTNQGVYPDTAAHAQLQTSYGSFKNKDIFIAASKAKNNVGAQFYGRYRSFEGKYPFTLRFGNYEVSGVRSNNQLAEYQIGGQFYLKLKKRQQLRLLAEASSVDQGLPGAIVLFNPTVGQFLFQEQQRLGLDIQKKDTAHGWRFYAIGQHNYLRYQDFTFLNKENYLESKYETNRGNAGGSSFCNLKRHTLHFGLDLDYADLKRNESNTQPINRFISSSVLGLEGPISRFNYQVQVGHQYAIDKGDFNQEHSLFSTSGVVSRWVGGQQKVKLYFLQSYTNRLPSFSEMYYNPIPNAKLKVERAWQNQLGAVFSFQLKKTSVELKGNGYYNRVFDKLIAIPTKNLFVWSIQNVGIVDIIGSEWVLSQSSKLLDNGFWNISTSINYTYQLAVDHTDRQSLTYDHQISYIPNHSFQTSFIINRKATQFVADLFWSDFRYALNQNIVANVLPAFYFLDVGISQKIRLKNNQLLTVQVNIKNCTDQKFVFVRSFPMPGRYYTLTLRYAI